MSLSFSQSDLEKMIEDLQRRKKQVNSEQMRNFYDARISILDDMIREIKPDV